MASFFFASFGHHLPLLPSQPLTSFSLTRSARSGPDLAITPYLHFPMPSSCHLLIALCRLIPTKSASFLTDLLLIQRQQRVITRQCSMVVMARVLLGLRLSCLGKAWRGSVGLGLAGLGCVQSVLAWLGLTCSLWFAPLVCCIGLLGVVAELVCSVSPCSFGLPLWCKLLRWWLVA